MNDSTTAAMDEAVEAVPAAIEELNDFLSYYQKKYPKTPADALPPPYVDDVVHPVMINAKATDDFGINDESVATENDEVQVLIYLNEKAQAGDSLMLMWDDNAVAGTSITEEEMSNKYKTLVVKGKDVPEGGTLLYYTLYKKNKAVLLSPKVSTLFIKGQPGVEGEKGVGAVLDAPIMTTPASGAIGLAEAKAGVIVTVPAYLSMRVGDWIYLYWGNQEIAHEVTEAQLNKPIAISVPESLINEEGESQELFVMYYVEDRVGNVSEWSDWVEVEVKLSVNSPDAPQVLSTDGTVITAGEIHITDIKSDHVVIQFPGTYQVGDMLLLHMVSKTEQDQLTPKNFGPLTVEDPAKPQQINVPFDEWWPLGGGSAQLSYTLTSSAGTISKSKSAYVKVLGMPSLLPVPTIFKVEDFRVAADRGFIHVLIPALANTKYMDKVKLSWRGVKSDGTAVSIPVKAEQVSVKHAGKDFPFRLKGNIYVKPFEGGYVDISYVVKRANGEYKSGTVRYEIGEPVASLPAPTTEVPLINNVLNPDEEQYDFNVVIKIPAVAEQPPCVIRLHWESSEGEIGWDELNVENVSADGLDFEVPRSVFEPKGDTPVKIKFYYKVIRQGVPTVLSMPLEFTVATIDMLKNFVGAPKVPSAVNNKLNLTAIVDNRFPVLLDYSSLAIGDEIIIWVGSYRTSKILLTKAGPHTQLLSLDQVLAQNMQSITDPANHPLSVSYELVRNGTTKINFSEVLTLQLEGAVTKENFESLKARLVVPGATLECPAFSVTMYRAGGAIISSHAAAFYPTRGCVLMPHAYTEAKFELRGLARTVAFDVADKCALKWNSQKHYVIFYTASGAEIARTGYLRFNPSPAGYTAYSMRVTFTTPSSAIKSFTFVDGGSNVQLDNFAFTPF
ncbi:hypothetical protein D3C79_320660 [compost metagenome]